MADAAEEYEKLVKKMTQAKGVTAGQMFGKPCLKINGKAFVAQHKETVVFKLPESAREAAGALKARYLVGSVRQKAPDEGMGGDSFLRKQTVC